MQSITVQVVVSHFGHYHELVLVQQSYQSLHYAVQGLPGVALKNHSAGVSYETPQDEGNTYCDGAKVTSL